MSLLTTFFKINYNAHKEVMIEEELGDPRSEIKKRKE